MQPIQQLTDFLWVNSSEVFAYHSGIFVSGGEAIVVDPGLKQSEIDALAQFVNENKWNVRGVILTHGHWDHVLGTEAFPNAPVIAQAVFLTSKRNSPDGIQKIVDKTPDLGITERFKMPAPTTTFSDRMMLEVGALKLELFSTPGHAPDHLFIAEQGSGTVWTADLLTDEEIPYVIDSLAVLTKTLDGIHPEKYRLTVPCHGTPARGDEIRARIDSDRAYLHELAARVGAGVKQGKSLDEVKVQCADIPYRQAREGNHRPHEMNVESAYIEFGGETDGTAIGWARSWEDLTD